jgi:hypothetical protein
MLNRRSAASLSACGLAFAMQITPIHAQSIDRLDTIGTYLGDCVHEKMRTQNTQHKGTREVVIRVSFRADGTFIGKPRHIFSMPVASQPAQQLYIADISNAMKSCTPLPFSKELSSAIAGRPFNFRYKLQPKQDLRA